MIHETIAVFSHLTSDQLVALVSLAGLAVAGLGLYVAVLSLKVRKP